MTNEHEETLEDRLDHLRRRAENFRELLKDGEEITIAFCDGQMNVAESYRAKFERKYPKLFGRLLRIDAQLETGWAPFFVALVASGFFLFGLQLGWWERWLGREVCDSLNDWWFYLLLPASALYLASIACGQWRKWLYRRQRRDLMALITHEKLDHDILLVMLRDIGDLDNVVAELRLILVRFPD